MRLSKETLEEIKDLRNENWFIYNPNSEVNEYIDELLSEIEAMQSELETLKDPSDGKCMEIGALRSSFETSCKEFETLQKRIDTLHKDNRVLHEKINSYGKIIGGLFKLLEKYKIIKPQEY